MTERYGMFFKQRGAKAQRHTGFFSARRFGFPCCAIMALSVFTFCCAAECSENQIPETAIPPFVPGEKLTFRVIFFGAPAGTSTLEVVEISELDGVPVYHLLATARSAALFSLFYKVRDRIESFVDIGTLLPLRFEKHQREGPRYRNDEVTIFDRSLNIARTGDNEMPVPVGVQDALSALYHLRMQPFVVGESVFVDVNADEKNYFVEVKVLRKELIKKWGKDMETVVVHPVLRDVKLGGILKEKGALFIWMSDDEKRIPVLITAKVVVGHLTFVLIAYEKGGASDEL